MYNLITFNCVITTENYKKFKLNNLENNYLKIFNTINVKQRTYLFFIIYIMIILKIYFNIINYYL